MQDDLLGIKDTSIEGDLSQKVDIMFRAGIARLEYSILHHYREQELWSTRSRRQTQKLLASNGISINSIFMSLMNKPDFNFLSKDKGIYKKIKTIIIETIDICREFETKVIVMPFFGNDLFSSHGTRLFIERINDICEIAKQGEVEILIENYLSARINKNLIKKVPSNNLKICFDTGNCFGLTGNLLEEYCCVKENIGEIHLKDFPVDSNVGDGFIDFKNFITKAHNNRARIPIIIEKTLGKYKSKQALAEVKSFIHEM